MPKPEQKSCIFPTTVKTVNTKKKQVDMIMSTERKDRHGEIILLSAWQKYLEAFMTHPVLLDNHRHNSSQDILGKYLNVGVEKEGLIAKAEYFVEQEIKNTPDKQTVRWAWVLVTNGLGAYSVSFIPHAGVSRSDMEALPEGIIPESVMEKEPYFVYTDVELIECSQVTVPSNRDALLRSINEYEDKGLVEQFSIAKGVFDQHIFELPKKTFIIGYDNEVSKKESLRIKCSVDVGAIQESILFHETMYGTKASLNEDEIAQAMTFEFVSESEPAELIQIAGAPKFGKGDDDIVVLPETVIEGKDIEKLSESLKGATKIKRQDTPASGEDFENLGKALCGITLKEGHPPLEPKEKSEGEDCFKECLDIFGING